ncbi:MAG: hypothetical protein WDM77_05100 [Steroidobacteraceae bacterium]
MRRLIFGLVVAAGVAAFWQSGLVAAAAGHNPADVEWTQHGGNPDEQRYSKLNQVTVRQCRAAGPCLVCRDLRARRLPEHAAGG